MPDTAPPGGRLALNIMQFCRVLRAAGLPIGPGKMLQALEAVRTVGVGSRADLYWTLHAALVNRRDQRELFDQAFHIFWRNPDLLKRAMALMLPQIETGRDEDREQVMRRLAEALQQYPKPGGDQGRPPPEPPELEIDATLTFSEREVLQSTDFEQMSAEELAQAKRAIAGLHLPVRPLPMRRFRASASGPRIDLRRTLRRSLRGGGATIDLVRKTRRYRPPPIVALCDISGSMSRYSRMLLHFLHAVTSDRDRVHSFVFGTRLTNVTRHLRHRDVDLALDRVAGAVEDWSGGTRIGTCLHDFNRWWGRRVLGQGAVVLLITDGLDRDTAHTLETEIERLHKSCRRLIWLNPLLRYDGYAPKSLGARQLMPHCDDFRPVHNLESLADLAAVLSREAAPADARMERWRTMAAA
ncbi:MAG: VWA domain-containing protein [Inquilinus sp.]|nr:VWA domain-containing protein [Inquilinus sp.]